MLLVATLTAAPAVAHNSLASTDPANGATLAEAPTEITLTFDDKVIEVGSVISVTGSDGEELADGDVVIERNVVTQPLLETLPAGDYEVLWRVTSADGHPIDGEFTFTAESAVGVDEVTEEPTEDTTEEESTPSADDTTDTDAAASDSDSDGLNTGLLIGIIVGGLILGFLVVLLVNKNRKSASAPATQDVNTGSDPEN